MKKWLGNLTRRSRKQFSHFQVQLTKITLKTMELPINHTSLFIFQDIDMRSGVIVKLGNTFTRVNISFNKDIKILLISTADSESTLSNK